MNIDELTIGQVKEISKMTSSHSSAHSFVLGEKYLIRTVTMIYTGRLESVTDSDLVLSDAAWIASTGRFAAALATGELDEVEPYPNNVIVSRAAIVDAAIWMHDLPRETK